MVGTKTQGYWLTMGKHRLSKAYKTKKEVLKHLSKRDWTLLTAIMIAFVYDRKLIDSAYEKEKEHNESMDPTKQKLNKV